jgi:hypothetical protein
MTFSLLGTGKIDERQKLNKNRIKVGCQKSRIQDI